MLAQKYDISHATLQLECVDVHPVDLYCDINDNHPNQSSFSHENSDCPNLLPPPYFRSDHLCRTAGAEPLSERGHQVTVMTTQYDKSLPREEMMDGVRVIRVPVAVRISKGVIAPTFGLVATRLVAEHDVVQLHLPQFDAPGVALRARLFGKPVVLTYHCDLLLPPGSFNRFVNLVVKVQNNLAALLANHIVTYTQDYADHSAYLSRYRHKLTPLLPPVVLPPAEPGAVEAFAGLPDPGTASRDRDGDTLRG